MINGTVGVLSTEIPECCEQQKKTDEEKDNYNYLYYRVMQNQTI